MAAPSLTYTLSNGSTADASQVMQNFNDLLNGITDGSKDLSISALTCAGTLTANGHVNLGNSSADDLTVTASLASSIPIKTTNSYDIGSSTLGLRALFFGANSQTVKIQGSSSMSATWTLTLPVTAGTNNYILTTNGSGTSAWTAWTNSAWYADGSNAGTLSAAAQTIGGAKTFSSGIVVGGNSTGDSNYGTIDSVTLSHYYESDVTNGNLDTGMNTGNTTFTLKFRRIGKVVFLNVPEEKVTANATSANWSTSGSPVPSSLRPLDNIYIPIFTINNNTTDTTPGLLSISASTGTFSIDRASSWTSGTTNCGFRNINVCWLVS